MSRDRVLGLVPASSGPPYGDGIVQAARMPRAPSRECTWRRSTPAKLVPTAARASLDGDHKRRYYPDADSPAGLCDNAIQDVNLARSRRGIDGGAGPVSDSQFREEAIETLRSGFRLGFQKVAASCVRA